MPQLHAVDQLAMDEQVIEDPDVEAALEERQKPRDSLGAVRKIYDEAHEKAVGEIAKLELPEGGVARVGRFRITRASVAARSVTFDTKPTSRLRISLLDAEPDVRPRGAVNVDALRGEADRASSE